MAIVHLSFHCFMFSCSSAINIELPERQCFCEINWTMWFLQKNVCTCTIASGRTVCWEWWVQFVFLGNIFSATETQKNTTRNIIRRIMFLTYAWNVEQCILNHWLRIRNVVLLHSEKIRLFVLLWSNDLKIIIKHFTASEHKMPRSSHLHLQPLIQLTMWLLVSCTSTLRPVIMVYLVFEWNYDTSNWSCNSKSLLRLSPCCPLGARTLQCALRFCV